MAKKAEKQNMSLKDFTHDLRRGLGSAIIELKNNTGKEKYLDIVMRSCLKDIAYDTQVEGTKGYFLYTAIRTFTNPEIFLENISKKFGERLRWRLSEQLYDMLCCFAENGYKNADEVFEKKYYELKSRLPLMRDKKINGFCERELLEKLMVRKLDNGFELYKQCINDMGEMIIKCGSDDCLWYDLFLTEAEEKFGNEVYDYIESAKNENVAAFNQSHKMSEADKNDGLQFKIMTVKDFCKTYRYDPNSSKEDRVTIEHLVSRAKELSSESVPNLFRIHSLAHKFAKQAKKRELKALALIAIEEPSDFIKTALLYVFKFADFPLDIEVLLSYMASESEDLRDTVIETLSRIKDNRIHTLATQLFNDEQVENAISLLESNFETEDEALIRTYVMRSRQVAHSVIMSITDIYEEHKSNTCCDILLHLYKNAECSHCRYEIVETMIDNGVIPKNILIECQYDSYEDTRNLAEKHYKIVDWRS